MRERASVRRSVPIASQRTALALVALAARPPNVVNDRRRRLAVLVQHLMRKAVKDAKALPPPFSFFESYVDLSVARRASAFGARLGSNRTEHIRASPKAPQTGRDILHTPNFQRDHREAERAGRCLNLTHIQQRDRIAGIGQNR
jgi:hypothetical protein